MNLLKNRNLCETCGKYIESLFKYNGKIIKCPYCGAYLRVYDLTQYYTVEVTPEYIQSLNPWIEIVEDVEV